MKDGAIVAKSGHFDLNLISWRCVSYPVSLKTLRPFVQEYKLSDGRRIMVLGEGR